MRPERGAKDIRRFKIGDREQAGVSVGSSEHFALPRVAAQLREVNCCLGWFGPASRAMQLMSGGMSVAMKLPGVGELWKAAGEKLVKGSSGGPDEEARSKTGSHIVAIAYDGAGHAVSEVHLTGVDGYTFTGRMLAWGAERGSRQAPRNRRARSRRRLRPRGIDERLRRGRHRGGESCACRGHRTGGSATAG